MLGFGFHLLGDGALAEHMGDVGDRAHDGLRQVGAFQPADEAAVDLDVVDVEVVEVAERAEPGAEIVEGEAAAQVAHLADETLRALAVAHDAGFGDFQAQVLRREAAAAQARGQVVGEVLVGQGGAAQVDAAAGHALGGLRIALQPAQRRVDHVAVDARSHAEALGGGNEFGGHVDACRRAPASAAAPRNGRRLLLVSCIGTIGWQYSRNCSRSSTSRMRSAERITALCACTSSLLG